MKTSLQHRGSVLIVALLLAAGIAISLGSFIALNQNSLKLANRTFFSGAALNLAETGAEEALWSFNQFTNAVAAGAAPSAALNTAWAGWDTSDGLSAKRTFTGFDFGQGATGQVKVYVDRYNPSSGGQPVVVAQARVTLRDGLAAVSKTIEVRLKRRSLFAMGLVAKDRIVFSGNNSSVDSWNSMYDNAGVLRPTPVAWSAGEAHDKGSVGTATVTSTISVQNGDIWGNAAVGGPSTTSISVGSQGRVGPYGTPVNTIAPGSVTSDFTANMEIITLPAGGTPIASVGATLGTTGSAAIYRFGGQINSSLTIYGNVTLYLTAVSGSEAIKLTGSDSITLAAGATLTIYTDADVKLGGNGLINSGVPKDFQLFGTSTSGTPQDFQISGNGDFRGLVYAPNSSVKLNGNGNISGSVVGKDITLTGNAAFHYDESLSQLGGENPFGVIRWREFASPSDRALYAVQLASF
jgi:hypothetical protein